MIWTKISPDVISLSPNEYFLPYIKGHNNSHVEMFGSPYHYYSIEADIAVKKDILGLFPILDFPFRYDEMVFFICNNWDSWDGQEYGFRFPLHLPSNWITVYAQRPYGGLFFYDIPLHMKDLEEYHHYKITVHRNHGLCVLFEIDDKLVFWFSGRDFNKPFLPVFTNHTRYNEDFGYFMKIRDVMGI
jgi:hypothetical protein